MRYAGSELELFAAATRWKSYALGGLRALARGRVLEVGAGRGANVAYLAGPAVTRWVCLEPDPALLSAIARDDPRVEPIEGTSEQLADRPSSFDTVFYIDVLEHIADDAGELERAAKLLAPGGRLVVLAPAHAWLFSEFDRAIGHFRRYTRTALRALTPAALRFDHAYYLDAAGVLASSLNRWLMRQPLPSAAQIRVWDRWLVPMSRVLDPLLGRRLGKTVVAVWTRPEHA